MFRDGSHNREIHPNGLFANIWIVFHLYIIDRNYQFSLKFSWFTNSICLVEKVLFIHLFTFSRSISNLCLSRNFNILIVIYWHKVAIIFSYILLNSVNYILMSPLLVLLLIICFISSLYFG